MTRTLILTLAALLAGPTLADGPAPKAEPAPARPADAPAAPAKEGRSVKPEGRRAADLSAHPRPGAPGASDTAKPRSSGAPAAAKPPPCVEVKPCSID